ncbi:MAG TPA: NAD-binding protein [Bacteroidales bacterium]|nr:NAD-binding protein [Bacteroidales bacterium]
MKKKITNKERFHYAFDKTMSKGTPALIMWLAILSVLLVLIIAAVIVIAGITPEGEEKLGFVESAWRSLMRTLDAGTMGGDNGWGFRILMLVVTIGGIFIVSTLIGVLSSGIESKLDELRKGRSFVIEKNHTLILGWSPKIFTIISELVTANDNQKKPRIVVLADKDKVEMEDEIREKSGDLKNTRVICRSGIPNDIGDLEIVNPHESKSIIILAPESEDADSQTIKTILAVTNNPNRRPEPYHIVAEIKEERFIDPAMIVGKDEVELLLTDDLISRIMVQTCRQSGLSVVYSDIMGFEGSEIYFNEEQYLTGKTYGESHLWYEDSAVVGMKTAGGKVMVNPPAETVFSKGDQVMAITEDDDTLVIARQKGIADLTKIKNLQPEEQGTEKTLILGWNHRGKAIIREMNNYAKENSEILIVASGNDDVEPFITEARSLYQNVTLKFKEADTTDRNILESLDPETFHHIIVLSYIDEMDAQRADARTLLTLLQLRHLSEEKNSDLSIVSEMMDLRNRELAQVTKADDFIVSDKLISMLLAQISENKSLMKVYNDLFQEEGSEIYLKPASNYIETGVPVNFYTVAASAARKNESAFGYRLIADEFNPAKNYGVKINPHKSDLVTFTEGDSIIVMAEN